MNHSVRYSLKDNNSLINIIYSNTILDFVINELLVNIDNYLSVFINNDIKLSLDKLNFDNLHNYNLLYYFGDNSSFDNYYNYRDYY